MIDANKLPVRTFHCICRSSSLPHSFLCISKASARQLHNLKLLSFSLYVSVCQAARANNAHSEQCAQQLPCHTQAHKTRKFQNARQRQANNTKYFAQLEPLGKIELYYLCGTFTKPFMHRAIFKAAVMSKARTKHCPAKQIHSTFTKPA